MITDYHVDLHHDKSETGMPARGLVIIRNQKKKSPLLIREIFSL